jgi:phospholipase C
MTRPFATLALCLAAVALPLIGPGPAGATPRPTAPPSPSAALRHVVVMTQGGRSFDNYFGDRAGVDGIPAGSCQLASRISQPHCMPPRVLTPSSEQAPLLTTAAAQVASVNRGGMNGFVRAQTSRRSDGTAANAYFRRGSLPVLEDLAQRGVLFDHWFSGVPGGTVANRLFAVTAQPAGDPLDVPAGGWPATATIFDRLTAAGVSWRVYVQNYEPALTIDNASTKQRLGGQVARVPLVAMRRYLDDRALRSHIVDLGRYYDDLAANRLPAVSWIVSTSTTEQAPQDPTRGQQLTRAVVNALLMSRAWAHAAFLLSYDSSGGWYDHVQPPKLDGATVGLRVPTLLLSPFVSPGSVQHAKFDAASTLKLIEQLWGLPALADRDRDARSPLAAFAFGRHPGRARLLAVPGDAPVSQPSRLVLYLGYLAAGCVVATLWGAVHFSGRRVRSLEGAAT